MSTRSQLRFVQRNDADTAGDPDEIRQRIAQVYRHCDGYPASVLRELTHPKQLLDATRTERGPDYAGAQLLLLDKLGRWSSIWMTIPTGTSVPTRPSISSTPRTWNTSTSRCSCWDTASRILRMGIHGDEEYLYVVELPSHTAFDEPGEWTVKVSEHCEFPRWDGPTEDAFDRATWQFEGTLTVALEELLAEPA